MNQIIEWIKSHSHAILGTIVFLQNSHLLGVKAEATLNLIGSVFFGNEWNLTGFTPYSMNWSVYDTLLC